MRAVVLLAIGVVLLATGCPQEADQDGPGRGEAEPAAAPDAAGGAPLLAEPPEPAAVPEGEEPGSWPAGAPWYPGSTVLASTYAPGPEGQFWNAALESTDSGESIAEFYVRAAQSAGGVLEETRAPDSVHYGYVIAEGKVDVRIQSQPAKSMVQLDVTPLREDEELRRMVSWFGIDDAPPEFPLDILPRCPGGVIEEAMIIADEVYILRVKTQTEQAEVLQFYDEHFGAQGWTLKAGSGEMAGRHVYEGAQGKINLDVVAVDEGTQAVLSFETAEFIKRRTECGEPVSEAP
jgi:hypothetical protein